MKKITCIVGTRPEAIKMAPVIHELRRDSGLAAGQRVSMTQALAPDENLNTRRLLP